MLRKHKSVETMTRLSEDGTATYRRNESRLSEWKWRAYVCVYVHIYIYIYVCIAAVRFSLAVLPANPLHSLQNERRIETPLSMCEIAAPSCTSSRSLSKLIITGWSSDGSSCESADTLLILINRLINRSDISHGYIGSISQF